MTDINVAGMPQRAHVSDTVGEAICVPLTGAPDELLIGSLRSSELVSSYCEVEADGASLILRPAGRYGEDIGGMLTAVKSVIDSVNHARSQAERLEAARSKPEDGHAAWVESQLEHWWHSQHR
jgi:hypothetical protein